MKTRYLIPILVTGFAMFSMFFGAGNVVFPLKLGQAAESHNLWAVAGLLITAVGVPFTGLFAMTLYEGDYKAFFARLGSTTGFLIVLAIIGLIGPFGALPRCIALSYSTTALFFPGLSIEWFSFISCLLIFFLTFKESNVLDIIGNLLTPFLMGSLAIIIIKGIAIAPSMPLSKEHPLAVFLEGLTYGYQTMDLLGAFFFSSVITLCLHKNFPSSSKKSTESIRKVTLYASLIGASLLALVYAGFSYVSALHSEDLALVPPDQLIGSIALHILGPYAGLIACTAVALACLTTAIALAAVSADYIQNELSGKRLSYPICLLLTLIVSFFVSTLNFTGIISFLAPILEVTYPALMALTVLNILHKFFEVKIVKTPFFLVLIISLLARIFY